MHISQADFDLPEGAPLGVSYISISAIAETIAEQTGIRSIGDFSMVLSGLGGSIERVPFQEWNSPEFFSLYVRGPKSFLLLLPSAETPLDRVLQASALGHYILHSREGASPSKFRRAGALQANQEALWFSLSLLIPDDILSDESADASLSERIGLPHDIIRLKRKIALAHA